MKVYMVRHGKTDWNERGLMQGMSDIPLNETGKEEAIKSRELLKDVSFDICISSPLRRTIQTAKIITDSKCEVICDDLLLERNLGEFEGKKHDEYVKLDYWNYNLNNSDHGVEPVRNVFLRTKKFLAELKSKNYDSVLLVSHAATIRAMHYNIIGYDKNNNFYDFVPKNGKVYEYDI